MDVDAAYGQLLRRINVGRDGECYALVVPASDRKAAERVESEVRSLLQIALYVVDDGGTVVLV